MKSFLTLVCLISSLLAALPPSIAASSNPKPDTNNTVTQDSTIPPIPKLQKTIDLSDVIKRNGAVMKMTFSPDSRYLGIVTSPEPGKTDIVVWDLKLDRQQALIHCPYNYSVLHDHDLLWIQEGRVITFGAKRQWDPMTGNLLPDNPAIGRAARLNKDGSKMLTIVGPIGDPSYIYIYDTKDWSLQKLYVDGLAAETAAWTAEDKILVGVHSGDAFGKTVDGRTIKAFDVALRLLDPTDKTPTKAVWFPAEPSGDPKWPFNYSFPVGSSGIPNFAKNEIFLDAGKAIDGNTLAIRQFRSFDSTDKAPGAFGMGFSPDGRFLYLKGASFRYGGHAPIKNSIVNTETGKPLIEFEDAMDHPGGLAVSPDGKHLALGDTRAVLIFKLQ